MSIKIACVGMTHLGIVYATAFASKGFDVTCYDDNAGLIANLCDYKLPINEPNIESLIKKHQSNILFTNDASELQHSNLVFFTHDMPTDQSNKSCLTYIQSLLNKIIPALSENANLILLSQVLPGYTRTINFPKERLFYQVETLVFGQAIERAVNPERYIVGQSDTTPLPEIYQKVLNAFQCPIVKMNYESAELTKIAINLFLVSSICTTNTLSEICEKIGANWFDIQSALRLDKRIGQNAYLTPGLGIAGGNLERDLVNIRDLGNKLKTNTNVISSWQEHCAYRRDWAVNILKQKVLNKNKNVSIAVLGLSYKPNTHSIKNSVAIQLIKALPHVKFRVHDPVVKVQINNVLQFNHFSEAIKGSDVLMIMTPWDEYKSITPDRLINYLNDKFIIDPYRVIGTNNVLTDNFHYFSLGKKAIECTKRYSEIA